MHISLLLFTLCICYTASLYGCLYRMFEILVYVKMSVWVFVNACMCLKELNVSIQFDQRLSK